VRCEVRRLHEGGADDSEAARFGDAGDELDTRVAAPHARTDDGMVDPEELGERRAQHLADILLVSAAPRPRARP
jgi:hypothetical protein